MGKHKSQRITISELLIKTQIKAFIVVSAIIPANIFPIITFISKIISFLKASANEPAPVTFTALITELQIMSAKGTNIHIQGSLSLAALLGDNIYDTAYGITAVKSRACTLYYLNALDVLYRRNHAQTYTSSCHGALVIIQSLAINEYHYALVSVDNDLLIAIGITIGYYYPIDMGQSLRHIAIMIILNLLSGDNCYISWGAHTG